MGISWEAEEEGPSTEPKPVAPTAIRKSIPSVKYFIFGLPFRHFFSAPVLRVERRFYIVRKVLPGWPFIPPPCPFIPPSTYYPIDLSIYPRPPPSTGIEGNSSLVVCLWGILSNPILLLLS